MWTRCRSDVDTDWHFSPNQENYIVGGLTCTASPPAASATISIPPKSCKACPAETLLTFLAGSSTLRLLGTDLLEQTHTVGLYCLDLDTIANEIFHYTLRMSRNNVFKLSGNMALGSSEPYNNEISDIKQSLKLLKAKQNQRKFEEPELPVKSS